MVSLFPYNPLKPADAFSNDRVVLALVVECRGAGSVRINCFWWEWHVAATLGGLQVVKFMVCLKGGGLIKCDAMLFCAILGYVDHTSSPFFVCVEGTMDCQIHRHPIALRATGAVRPQVGVCGAW